MPYEASSITNSDPGVALYARIESLALIAGWTVDDTVIIGGNTHKVLKSAAAGNTLGKDFWIDINYPTLGTTGGMRMLPIEVYNNSTHQATRGAVNVSSTVFDATTYSRYGAAASALETNWFNTASATNVSMPLVATPIAYYITVTRDRIAIMTSNNPNLIYYTGLFTGTADHIAHAGSAYFPLIMCRLTATWNDIAADTNVAMTRMPKVLSEANANRGWSNIANVYAHTLSLIAGTVGGSPSPVTNKITVVNPIIYKTHQPGSFVIADFMGYLSDIVCGIVIGSAGRGDTVTVGADTWVCAGQSAGNAAIFMKAV